MQLITSKSGRTWLLGAALLTLSLNGSTQAFPPTVHLHAHGGRVRFNRLGGRKRGELYGGREAEIGRSLKITRVQKSRDRESTEGSENSIRIVAPARGFWGA